MFRCTWIVVALSLAKAAAASIVFPSDTTWSYFPGRSEASPNDPSAWRLPGFDDSAWATGLAPFYYEDSPTSTTAYSGNTQLTDMRGNYTSLFLRKTFLISNPSDVQELTLRSFSDDGFIAWINGAEVARFNMPLGEVAFDGLSLAALAEPISIQTNLLGQSEPHLIDGENVIAVQAFNAGLSSSSDFVISVEMASSVDDTPPTVDSLIPAANALVRQLTQVEVFFSEGVTGVEAADLLINGQPATRVTPFNDSQFIFEFPQPSSGQVNLSWSPTAAIHDLASAANPFTGKAWNYTLDPNAAFPGLILSEFMADNKKTLHDEDGDSSDWIEIYNAGSTTASLSGSYLTSQRNVSQWRFPNVTVLPNSYLVVFASGKNRADASAPLHTNFKLDKAGGYLALLDSTGQPISAFEAYPAQLQDVSYGHERVNPALTGFFPNATPGAANTAGGPGFAPAVEFSRPGGTFVDPFALTLTTDSPDGVIHYTLDGTLPTETSAVYSGPISVNATVQVRARSFISGLLPSAARSESYLALAANVLSFSSDLPVVVLHNFQAGRVPAGVQQFANIAVFEPGFGRTSLTNEAALSVRAGINLRGSSTLGQAKSNFRVEFWDDYNDAKNYPLLGMPSDNDWVLYAPNNFEPVLMHNIFMHNLSRDIGRYSPRARFVEVYVNTTGGPITQANYNGVYVLLEKIKVGQERVDIAPLQPENTRSPQVSGGYLMSVDRGAPGEGQLYAGGLGVNALNPKWDELVQPQRTTQYQFITQFLDTFESVLTSPNFADPVNGYAKYVDVDAAIDHHILNVLAFNVDALRLSGYLFKPRDGKLTFGPLWDFDRALGSTDGRDSNPRVWRSASADRGTDMFNSDPNIFTNPWFSQMFKDPDFWQRWIDRWQELRQGEFALTNLHGRIDSLANQVREAERREIARWAGFTSPRGGTYQAEVDRMKNWLSNRVDFIDTNFLAMPLLSAPGGPVTEGSTVTLAGPQGATLFYTLDGSDPRATGGDLNSQALTYSEPITLTRNARLVARARDLNHRNLTGANKPPLSSPWSGAVAATYVISTPPLAITELMYHPAPANGKTTNDVEDFEFIELKNTGSATLNLVGFKFTHGIDYTFSAASAVTTLEAGQYLILVKNRAAFLARYPSVTNIAGEYVGSLDNAGERIALQGPLQEPVLDFTYNNQWFPPTDGLGFSLVAINDSFAPGAGSDPLHWRVSSALGGSPGRVDSPPPSFPPVLVNEALTHTDLPELDAVELFNPTAAAADISGWFLTDDVNEPKKFQIPSGTSVPPGGFKVFDASQFNAGPNPFNLSSLGEQIYLFSGNGTDITGYAHGFSYGAAANGIPFGRYVDSVGKEHFVAQSLPTLGLPNAGPRIGPIVLSEIMANPAPLGTTNNVRDEYVELLNITADPVPLYDPAAPTNTWRLNGGVELDFPTNLTLAPNQAMLAVNFNPATDASALAAFSARYNFDPRSVLIIGPFKGNLDNAGDHVSLDKPDPPEPADSARPGYVPYVLIDEVHYRDQAPWPTGASGTGQSIHRLVSSAYADDPSNWHVGPPSPGMVLKFDSIQTQAGVTTLRFQAAAGNSYSVRFRDSLLSGSWIKLTDVPASAASGPAQVTDSAAGSTGRFYQLVTPALP